MIPSAELARARWLKERSTFDAYTLSLKTSLQKAVQSVGVYAEVSARTKEPHSLVKKLLAKPTYTLDTLPDKVGVRIIVAFRSDLTKVKDIISETFSYSSSDDKAHELAANKLGYQSIHFDGLAFSRGVELETYPANRFFAELQLRTQAQHLWSGMSHDSFYKNDATVVGIPDDLMRRLNLMAGLIEVADREFDRMKDEVPADPVASIYKELEPFYYRLSAERPNIELSLAVIRLLLPLYGAEEPSRIVSKHIQRLFTASEATLHHVYEMNDKTAVLSSFLHQPEALLLYDRLLVDRDQTLTAWSKQYPPDELANFASVFGISLD